MRAISRRIGRLENSLGVVETEDMRDARERVETLRQRQRAWRAREGIPEPEDDGECDDRDAFKPQTIAEALQWPIRRRTTAGGTRLD
jgi:hypothetical protein